MPLKKKKIIFKKQRGGSGYSPPIIYNDGLNTKVSSYKNTLNSYTPLQKSKSVISYSDSLIDNKTNFIETPMVHNSVNTKKKPKINILDNNSPFDNTGSINHSSISESPLVNNIKDSSRKMKPKLFSMRDELIIFLSKYGFLLFFIIFAIVYISLRIRNSHWYITRKSLKQLTVIANDVNPTPVILCSAAQLNHDPNLKSADGTDNSPNKLCNFYVASSYRTCSIGGEYGYISTDALKKTLEAGCRFIDFDIFNSTWGEYAEPVVASGKEIEQIITSQNTVKFEEIAQMCLDCAFSSTTTSNYSDPLFINFNIKVNKNFYTLNKLANIIIKYFHSKLLGKEYSYQRGILGQASLDKLSNKVILFADKDFENSELVELINASPRTNFCRILKFNKGVKGAYDHSELIDFNRRWLTVCLADSSTSNEDAFTAWIYGCQFVCINYSIKDTGMNEYSEKFKESSFIYKPYQLLWHPPTITKPPAQDKQLSFQGMTQSSPFFTATI